MIKTNVLLPQALVTLVDLDIMLRPFGFLAPNYIKMILLLNLLIFNAPDKS
jgi:hypothetical protein